MQRHFLGPCIFGSMKTLSTLLFALLVLVMASCSSDSKDDPQPVTHKVEVRVTGQDLAGLGAELKVTSQLDFAKASKAGPGYTEVFGSSVSKTIKIGDFGTYDLIESLVMFKNVTRTSSLRPSSTSRLKLEILADGKVIETTELNASATGWKVRYEPYLVGGADLETDNL